MANLTGIPGVGPAGPTSQVWTTPWPHRPGERARDLDGNEYLFCSFITTNVGDGTIVSINANNEAAPLLATSLLATRVGVARATASAGVDAGWVQIYGIAFVWAKGSAASTDATSIYANGVSVSEGDASGLFPTPQLVVTSPSGSLGFVAGAADADPTSLVSVTSNITGYHEQIIRGMFILTQAQVSALPDRFITARYPNVTSPVSAVSDTSGPVTLTTMVSNTSGAAIHVGGEMVVFLNYPYMEGVRTT